MTPAEALAALRRFVMEACGHPDGSISLTVFDHDICTDCGRKLNRWAIADEQARHARAVEALAVLEGE